MTAVDDHDARQERLRASLHERAGDIRSTPVLWERTEQRFTRNRRRLLVVSALGAAAVVSLAAVIGGAVTSRGDRDGVVIDQPGDATPTPTSTESSGPAQPVPGRPNHALAAQATMLVAFDFTSGEVARWQVDLGRAPVRLALRPGTSEDRPVVAWASVGGTGWEVGVSEIDVATGQVRDVFVEQASPGLGADQAVAPGPAWSPDGRDLAWVSSSVRDGAIESHLNVRGLDGTDVVGSLDQQLLGGPAPGRAGVTSWSWTGDEGDVPIGQITLVGDGRVFSLEIAHLDWRPEPAALDTTQPQEMDPLGGLFDLAWDGTRHWALVRSTTQLAEPVAWFDVVAWDGSGEVALHDVGPFPPAEDAELALVGGVAIVASGGEVRTVAVDRPDEFLMQLQDPSASWHGVALPIVTIPPGGVPVPPAPAPDPTTLEPVTRSDALPGMVVTGAGHQLVIARSDGATVATFDLAIPTDASYEIVGLDVRPGSTHDDATVAILLDLDDRPHLAWARLQDGTIRAGEFDAAHQPWRTESFLSVDGEMPVPRFSGDGRFVGWVETGPGGERTLRTVGWLPGADAPGTGRTADDNAAFGLGPGAGTLEFWSNPVTSRSDGQGSWVMVSNADATVSTCEFEHQADGALALIMCEADVAVDRQVLAITDWAVLEDAGATRRLLRLDDPDGEPLPLPTEVAVDADPTAIWLARAGADAVFVGFDGRAWLVTVDGAQELGGTITTIAALA